MSIRKRVKRMKVRKLNAPRRKAVTEPHWKKTEKKKLGRTLT